MIGNGKKIDLRWLAILSLAMILIPSIVCAESETLQADFEVASMNGLTVTFRDLSMPEGNVTSWNWNFGDPMGDPSTDQNPTYTYPAAGLYDVTLNVADKEGHTSIIGHQINVGDDGQPVLNPPVASFEANPSGGEAPLDVQFTDTSTGEPSSWLWEFGDGDTSTAQSPRHTYEEADSYTVTLTATNADGSDDDSGTIEVKAPIIRQPPQVAMECSPEEGDAPLTVQFHDASLYGTERLWRFGDGTTSTDKNPVHTYTESKMYTASLTVTNAYGSKYAERDITVKEPENVDPDPEPTPDPTLPVADGKANVTEGYAPLTVQFTDLSENATDVDWDFDDGTSSANPDPVHTFTGVGIYDVKLNASNMNGSDEKILTINVTDRPVDPDPVDPVEPIYPVADGKANVTEGYAPLTVQFTDLSENATDVDWDFDDGTSSANPDPVHTFTGVGIYDVKLNASNMNGSDEKILTINVTDRPVDPDPVDPVEPEPENLLTIDFESDVSSGFAPLEVQFTDKSGNATSWKWTFGDGISSTERSPSHIFNLPKAYTVTLTVGNGTDFLSKSTQIEVFEPEGPTLSYPKASFTSNVSKGCVPLTVKFTDTSDDATAWCWDFGDGANSTERNPVHTYCQAGTFEVVLTVSNANGNDTASADIVAKKAEEGSSDNGGSGGVPTPSKFSAKIGAGKTCGVSPFIVQFTDLSGLPENGYLRVWDFGDGNKFTGMNPVHTYCKAGKYPVTLTIIDCKSNARACSSVCVTVVSKQEQVSEKPVPAEEKTDKCDISGKKTADSSSKPAEEKQESKQKLEYLPAGSDNGMIPFVPAIETIGGGSFSHKKSNGFKLWILSDAKVPVAAFSAAVVDTPSSTVQFCDLSTNDPTSWKWDFGDGSTSIEQNPAHEYCKAGKYAVSLTVKNKVGGTILTKMDYINVRNR